MSERIARPTFYEGQILRAADLELGQGYTRGAMARHERYLHTPGIATGLELTVDKSTGVVEVKLAPGIAVDATGRQIVVDRQRTLAAEDLDSLGVLIPADTDPAVKPEDRPWHPVFLVGHDESSTPPSLSRGCGGGGQPNRTDETYLISYGFPSDRGDDPPSIEVSDGPDVTPAPRVLIGYVQWDGVSGFADAQAIPKAGMSPPYAGARADEVVSRSGTLSLRADQDGVRDKRPALVLDGERGGEVRFGLQDARGAVKTPVFRVDAAGNVEVSGTIKSSFNNDLLVESGIVFDGLTVPLPAGVTPDSVDAGQIALHVTVTPRRGAELRPPGLATGTYIRESFECRVDGRRVFVRDRWFDVANLTAPITIPAACDYVIVASVSGGTP
jgi:hypothetical protein